MGQKANPIALRLGINKDWNSRWYAPDNKTWTKWLIQDKKIRQYLEAYNKEWALSNIEIDRTSSEIKVTINTSKPGMVIGQEASNLAKIKKEISKIIREKELRIEVKVKEIPNSDLDAKIIANEIAIALENRTSFRIAQKRVINRVMRSGAKGIKTQISGRLNGVDMARTEGYSEGVVPQQTFRNDLDYALAEAHTTYGVLGVKVWISKGELLKGQERKEIKKPGRNNNRRPQQRDNRGSRPAYKKPEGGNK
ncbi:MAG: 30S ribosomal protein S3 [Candidatus Tyloplasma litorale]|nr:MAG: 30S ribosomal protein S3 [Mycoplasmatales bacterium]